MTDSQGTPVIELDGLGVRLGRRAILHDLTGSLAGRAIGLLGPNGAGKSTLIRTLLGFHKLSSGSGRVLGHDISKPDSDSRLRIGYMPENDAFIAGMSGIRFVTMMAELTGMPPEQALERSHEALFWVGLGEARYRNLETYSLGMKQLAKLAQAVVHGPRLLILDEPTNGLDPPARARMLRLIREIRDGGLVNVLISSHLLRDVEECCDDVLILKDGRLAAYCNLEAERRANRKFLELELFPHEDENGLARSFLQAAEGLGCEWVPAARRRTKMVIPEGVEISDLYAIANDKSVQLRRLSFKKDSLEDIFLKAMDGQMTPGGPDGRP